MFYFILFYFILFLQLFDKMLGFTQPEDDNEENKNAPVLPPAFHPLLERMDEQENRYEYVLYGAVFGKTAG